MPWEAPLTALHDPENKVQNFYQSLQDPTGFGYFPPMVRSHFYGLTLSFFFFFKFMYLFNVFIGVQLLYNGVLVSAV